MGVQDLQSFLESYCQQSCEVVNLLSLSRESMDVVATSFYRNERRARLVFDVESCINRLYGGYYSDWVCGGQWSRMLSLLTKMHHISRSANVDMLAVVNGTCDQQRRAEWCTAQKEVRGKIMQVMRHIHVKSTPPHKALWVPPACVETCLRLMLRYIGMSVTSSMHDHHQEVIALCREYNCSGIVASNADYIVFNPPRLFSAQSFKMTFKGALEAQEIVLDKAARCIDLHPSRFPVLAALLGNHILTVEDLQDVHCRLFGCHAPADLSKLAPADIIRGVINFVRSVESVDDINQLGHTIFRGSLGNIADKVSRFESSVHYYMNGTKEGFLKYLPKHKPVSSAQIVQPGSYNATKNPPTDFNLSAESSYTDTVSGYGSTESEQADPERDELAEAISQEMNQISLTDKPKPPTEKKQTPSTEQTSATKGAKSRDSGVSVVHPQILSMAADRHREGVMHPWVHQLLTQRELQLCGTLEDVHDHDLPTAVDLYRLLRQHTYAVLFDLHKHRAQFLRHKDDAGGQHDLPRITITEHWVGVNGAHSDEVEGLPVDWLLPGLWRLWFSNCEQDKTCRLKAFLSCLHCDQPSALLLNTSYVPQTCLIMCCVLRYMVVHRRLLSRFELEAFLTTAVSQLLRNPERVQELELPQVDPRGVHLASLFMSGVEHAVFVNDVVGAPIPWHLTCPWLYFDGKVFHLQLMKAKKASSLRDLCDGQPELVLRVERMLQAVLQGCPPGALFSSPPWRSIAHPAASYHNVDLIPAGAQRPPRGRGIGRGNTAPGVTRPDGGQLEVAGIVVGNWGGNRGGRGSGRGSARGRRGNQSAPAQRGKGTNNPVSYQGDTRPNSNRGSSHSGRRGRGNTTRVMRGGQMFGGRGSQKKRNAGGLSRDMMGLTLEERTRTNGGRGRASTIESPTDDPIQSPVISSSLTPDCEDDERFVDADHDNLSTYAVQSLNNNAQNSPKNPEFSTKTAECSVKVGPKTAECSAKMLESSAKTAECSVADMAGGVGVVTNGGVDIEDRK